MQPAEQDIGWDGSGERRHHHERNENAEPYVLSRCFHSGKRVAENKIDPNGKEYGDTDDDNRAFEIPPKRYAYNGLDKILKMQRLW